MPGNWLVLSANEELAGRAVENLLGETSPELAKASKNCLKAWASRVSRERYEELVAERSRGVAQRAGAKERARKRKALLEILDDEASTKRLARELGAICTPSFRLTRAVGRSTRKLQKSTDS